MNRITLPAYAKINLHLEITGTRPDGYHSVESVMQTISLADTLALTLQDEGISLVCNDPSLPPGEDNLVMRAARAFYAETNARGGVHIDLYKRIPSGAGMGGGSSDAAATLNGLNRLYEYPLSETKLHAISTAIGADVPFCLGIGAALAEGIGTELTFLPALPICRLVIGMKNGSRMSTKAAYAALDAIPFSPRPVEPMLHALCAGDPDAVRNMLFNRFTVLNPEACEGMNRLTELGARATLLCGSGTAFFGIYPLEHSEDAVHASQILAKEGYRTWLAEPIG